MNLANRIIPNWRRLEILRRMIKEAVGIQDRERAAVLKGLAAETDGAGRHPDQRLFATWTNNWLPRARHWSAPNTTAGNCNIWPTR